MVKATKNLGTAIYIEGLQLGVRIVDCVAKHMDHPIAASRQQKSDAHGLDVSIHVQLRIADVVQSSRGFEHVLDRTGTHTGTLVQQMLGLDPLPALDIRQQCAGFAYGLQMVDALIKSGAAKTVLLVGTDVHTALMPFSEETWSILDGESDGPLNEADFTHNSQFRHLVVLFGDAAGAMVFRAHDGDDGRGILGSALYGDGNHLEILFVPGVGSANRPFISQEMLAASGQVPQMDGRSVFKLAVTRMPEATRQVLSQHGYSQEDLDLLIMHQANLRINEAAQKQMGLPDEKVHNNIQKYGNTTSATLPLAFHEARQAGKAPEGALVAFTVLGAGLHWGSVLMRV